jgi:hypothetical protein
MGKHTNKVDQKKRYKDMRYFVVQTISNKMHHKKNLNFKNAKNAFSVLTHRF